MAVTDTLIDMLRSWYNGLTAIKVDGSAVTQPISAASLPLPTSASTASLQTTGNTSLSSIDDKLSTANTLLTSIDADVTPVYYSYSNLTGNATTTVKSGSGVLYGIIIGNNGTGGTAVIYDNTAGSGTIIATITISAALSGARADSYLGPLTLRFNTGLTVVTSGSTSNNLTILYS